MIDVNLNTGKVVSLTPTTIDGMHFDLVDENRVVHLTLRLDENHFVIEDRKDILDDGIEAKLETLFIELENQRISGIEDEVEDTFSDPFDPEEISIDTKKFSMDSCLRRLTQGTIKLNPDFQRQEVWTIEKKSQLIESLMLKIPIPMFYVSSDEKSHLTVVDGLQRLSTIRDFILGKKYIETKEEKYKGIGFQLQSLEFWKEYEGKNFKSLPTNIINRILETEFTFTIINPGTPEEVRRNIFKRLNTGGMPLSSQEIRNALYIGKSTVLLNKLSMLEIYKKATDYSIKSLRMEDKELILRFISFLVRKYDFYNRTVNVDTWLSDTMIILNSLPELDSRELKKLVNSKNKTVDMNSINQVSLDFVEESFIKAMRRASKLFGKHAFRKSYPGVRRTPINKSLFETWGVLLSEMSEINFNKLYTNKDIFMREYTRLINNYDFVLTISRDSMKAPSVKSRFEKIIELINKYSS